MDRTAGCDSADTGSIPVVNTKWMGIMRKNLNQQNQDNIDQTFGICCNGSEVGFEPTSLGSIPNVPAINTEYFDTM